jgi:hypothetical protein
LKVNLVVFLPGCSSASKAVVERMSAVWQMHAIPASVAVQISTVIVREQAVDIAAADPDVPT